jgi:hypothetical protein
MLGGGVQRPDIGNGTNSVYAVAVDDVQHGEHKIVALKECKQGCRGKTSMNSSQNNAAEPPEPKRNVLLVQ